MIRVEFHCHTACSHDAFTTESELAAACAARDINVVTITEHDRFVPRPYAALAAAGVRVVQGCEFTCGRGTHVIGLFLERDLGLTGRSAADIVGAIRAAGGLAYLPHPFKPVTGYFTQYGPDALLDQVDMMELHNGGYRANADAARIRTLAESHDIRLVAGSDSHTASQVGYYVSEYDAAPAGDLKKVFRAQDARLLVDASRIKPPRVLNAVQRRATYQWLVQRIPANLKRPIKAMFSRPGGVHGAPGGAAYREVD